MAGKKRSNVMGLRLQKLREAAGKSQSALALEAGVPASSLRNWEQGRRKIALDDAWRLAQALGISLDELAEGAFSRKRKPKHPGKGE